MKKLAPVFLVAALLLLPACSRKTPEPRPLTTEEFMAHADALLDNGNTNTCISHLECGLANAAYAPDHNLLFRRLILLHLEAGQLTQAEQLYLTTAKQNGALAQGALGILYRHHGLSGDRQRQLAWTARLIELPLPATAAAAAYGWRLHGLLADDDIDQALALIPACIQRFDDRACYRLLSDFLRALIRTGNLEHARRLLETIREAAEESATLQSLADTGRTDLLIAEKKWAEAEIHLRDSAPRVPDNLLAASLNRAGSVLIAATQWTIMDRVCEFMLTRSDKPTTRAIVGSLWLQAPEKRGQLTDLPRRLNHLLDLKIPTQRVVIPCLKRVFYVIMNGQNTVVKSNLLKVVERTIPTTIGEHEKGLLETYIVDGFFMIEDYDRSLKQIEKRVTGRDDLWHSMATSKISAHKALAQGNKSEAIRFFRAFMDYIKGRKEVERNPATNIEHTSDMTLGFNAKRIAKIYASMGDKEKADAASQEALLYYAQALSNTEAGSAQEALIRSQMKDMDQP